MMRLVSGDPAQTDIRQFRHHTTNALARIHLTAANADAPGAFEDRLSAQCRGLADLIGDGDQYLTLACSVQGDVPADLQEIMLRVAREFVGSAVKHGMTMRLIGRIEVEVKHDERGTVMDVIDDGWNCCCRPSPGEGMRVVSALVAARGGRISLERQLDWTVARLELPLRRHDA